MTHKGIAQRLLLGLLAVNGVFMLLHIGVIFLNPYFSTDPDMLAIFDRFNMDAEVSVPTWFAQTLLFVAAALLYWMGKLRRDVSDSDARYWFILSAVMLYVSIDEGSGLHELTAAPVREWFGITQGPFVFAWVIPVAIIVAILGLSMMAFFKRLDQSMMKLFALSAILFVGGAMGMEIVAGAYWTSQDFLFDQTYSLITMIEEALENTGTIVFIYALVQGMEFSKEYQQNSLKHENLPLR